MSTALIASNIDHIPKRLICLDLLIVTHTDAYQISRMSTEFMAYKHCSHTGAYQNIWDELRIGIRIFFGNFPKAPPPSKLVPYARTHGRTTVIP